ncbi:hypothetical protein GA0061098_101015 [Bradyrhizobium shewense]|uniref:Uncharacterized protein n=1 Tax=Bradyrhizobium shewense TaxID=1761772 RepID=A0A1C3WUE8_9BRAD|nr:hypothetical protein GA0061098_101015 [Bradyrhizobium shewense]
MGECQCCLGRCGGSAVSAMSPNAALPPPPLLSSAGLARNCALGPGDPVRRGGVAKPRGRGVLDAPVKPEHDSGVCGSTQQYPAQLSHFATLFPLVLSFGTTLERIAAESLTPSGVMFRSRNMSRESCWLQLDGVFGRRTSDVSMAQTLKLGTARSRIRIGEESNGFRDLAPRHARACPGHPRSGGARRSWMAGTSPAMTGTAGTNLIFAKTTPCTVGKWLKLLDLSYPPLEGSGTSVARPWVGSHGAQRNVRRRGVISPQGQSSCGEITPPRSRCARSTLPLQGRVNGTTAAAYCVFATLGGWAVVMKLVASSMAGPRGVGTFSQNGTRTRVPATGANAISMLRWAARYLITGRSGM